jgi:N-acetylglutamate synthase-like GNAT family acetyltransferase
VKRELKDGYAIRYATVEDAVLLARLATDGGDPIAADMIAALAADRRVFMAEEEGGGEAVGIAATGEIGGAMAVEALAVLPAARGHGVGSALLTTVEEFGRWAFFPSVIAVARTPASGEFLFRRGYLSADPERLPPDLVRLGHGMPVLVKRL